jgi:hypothetical protein
MHVKLDYSASFTGLQGLVPLRIGIRPFASSQLTPLSVPPLYEYVPSIEKNVFHPRHTLVMIMSICVEAPSVVRGEW